jgi:hypothetical protein
VIVFLDPVNTDAETQKGYLDTLKKLNEKFQKTYRFGWVNGITQSAAVDQLNLHAGFPAVTIMNAGKKRAAIYTRSYTENGISSFLDSFLVSAKGSFPFDGPTFVAESLKAEL